MKKVYVAPNLPLAYHLEALLAEVGIPALVRGEFRDIESTLAPTSATDLPSVWVLDDGHADLAKPLVDHFRDNVTGEMDNEAPASPWRCPGCGEDVEGQFALCWSCGGERPAEGSAAS